MQDKQHLIFGSGLIGTYLAGCFLSKKLDVTLLGRASVREKLQHGLIVQDLHGDKAILDSPNFILEPTSTFDVIWLTVKCTAIEKAIVDLKKVVTDNTIIICCQNGFGSTEKVRRAFANNTILTAVFGSNVALVEQSDGCAVFRRASDGKFVVESHPELKPIVERVDSILLPSRSSTDITAEQWAKLQLNLANAVNALANVPVKTMVETPGYRKIIAALMRELLSVTKELNINLPQLSALPARWIPMIMGLPNWAFLRIAQKTLAIDPTAKASMSWDLLAGQTTEIEYLNGALVRKAKELGIHCPVNSNIVNLVQQVESGHASIGFSAEELQASLIG